VDLPVIIKKRPTTLLIWPAQRPAWKNF
jgi:hypothetical protein